MSALSEPSTARQQVSATVLFADICGSTRLFERFGDWQARRIESRVLDLLSEKTVEFGGSVIKTIGDEIMAQFPEADQAVNAACEMHAAIKDDPVLAELSIAVHIGLHHGPVLVERNDLFGDAVNVAARMVSQAKADQIITTRETVLPTQLSDGCPAPDSRSGPVAGPAASRTKWRLSRSSGTKSGSLTQMVNVGQQEELRNLLFGRLILEYRGARIEVDPASQLFALGRGDKNHLVVDRELVSRSHADIEFRQGKFILVDHSTNGTYLLLENGSRFFVRREEFTLQDRGIICLGQAVADDNPDLIRFQCLHA